MKDFKDLLVWQKALDLEVMLYRMTRKFPKEEIYGFTSQIRRSAGSIGANIAEGCGSRSDGELGRFVQIARGSSSELEHHLLIAKALGFLPAAEWQNLQSKVSEVQRMLTAFSQTIHSGLEKVKKKAVAGSSA
jgi:four helix bundle protein